jgi:putative hydroxymethylpyrimidine transport system permease protein
MLHANARMQVSLMFAALFVLALFSVGLYTLVDRGLRAAMPWQREDLDAQ